MYKETEVDKKNLKWFKLNKKTNTLIRLTVKTGNIRGIYPSTINFEYPITAIAGTNGSGKSTVLALACCAFHNNIRQELFYAFPITENCQKI